MGKSLWGELYEKSDRGISRRIPCIVWGSTRRGVYQWSRDFRNPSVSKQWLVVFRCGFDHRGAYRQTHVSETHQIKLKF